MAKKPTKDELLSALLGRTVARWVLHETGRVRLGWERKYGTVLFLDTIGWMEQMQEAKPEEQAEALGQLYEAVGGVALKLRGFVDKFVGDGAMVLFGVPDKLRNAARVAVQAALTMEAAVAALPGGETRLGIGLATGPIIAGFFGHPERFSFTAFGPTVNRAAFLCREASQALEPDGGTVLDEETMRAVGGGIVAEPFVAELPNEAGVGEFYRLISLRQ